MSIAGQTRKRNGDSTEENVKMKEKETGMGKDHMFSFIETGELRIGCCGYIHHSSGLFITKDISDFDVLYIVSGRYSIEINGKETGGRKGELLLLAPGSVLRLRALTDSEQYFCHFSIGKGDTILYGAELENNRYSYEQGSGLEQIYIKYIKNYIKSGMESSEMLLRMGLKLILAEMIRRNGNDLTASGEKMDMLPETIQTAVKYIQRNLGEELSTEKLSRIIGFHPIYFSAYFKKYMGITPCAYITKMRMESARHLVCDTNRKMKEIAGMLGFPDQYAFSRKFRRYFGMAPTRMRQTRI